MSSDRLRIAKAQKDNIREVLKTHMRITGFMGKGLSPT